MIDPNIALAAKAPQIESPFDQYGKLLTLANLGQQSEMGALQLQQTRQAMQDDKTMRQVMAEHSGELETALPALAGKVSPTTWIKLQGDWIEQQKNKLGLAEQQNKVQDAFQESMGKLALGVKAAGNTPEAFQGAVDSILKLQPAMQDALAPYLAQAQTNPASIGTMMDGLIAGTTVGQKEREVAASESSAASRASTAATAAARQERDADEQDFQRVLSEIAGAPPADSMAYQAKVGGLKPAVASRIFGIVAPGAWDAKTSPALLRRASMTGQQQSQADQAAANAALQARDSEVDLARTATDPTKTPEERAAANAALKRLDQSRREARPVIQNVLPGLPGQTGAGGGQQSLTGQAYLDTLSPGLAGQVRAIAEGRAVMPSASTRSQAAIQLRDAVFQYDPGYSDQRAQIRRAFTTGTDGRNIGALNTATVHLDQFADAAQAMGNGMFRPGNAAWNSLRTALGSTAPTNFAALKSAVSGEMANALKGNATDIEIHNVAASIDAANSAQQLADVIKTNLHVLAAKLNTYRERYDAQMPGDTAWSPVLPSAAAVYQKHGVASGTAASSGGGRGGKTYAQTAVGPNGHTIGWNPGDQHWTDVQTGQPVR